MLGHSSKCLKLLYKCTRLPISRKLFLDTASASCDHLVLSKSTSPVAACSPYWTMQSACGLLLLHWNYPHIVMYPVSTCCPYFVFFYIFQVKIGHQWLFLKALSSLCLPSAFLRLPSAFLPAPYSCFSLHRLSVPPLRYLSRICLGPAFCLHHTLHLNILSFPKISATLLTNSRLLCHSWSLPRASDLEIQCFRYVSSWQLEFNSTFQTEISVKMLLASFWIVQLIYSFLHPVSSGHSDSFNLHSQLVPDLVIHTSQLSNTSIFLHLYHYYHGLGHYHLNHELLQ